MRDAFALPYRLRCDVTLEKTPPFQCPTLMANIHLLPNSAARFGGLHRKTPSPFPTACNETQRTPKHCPFQSPTLMANIHLLTALFSTVFSFRRGGSFSRRYGALFRQMPSLFIDKFAGAGIVERRIRLSDRMACGSLGAADLLCVNILAHIFDQSVIFRLCRSKFFVIDKRRRELTL